MNFHNMKYFLTIVEEGSISKAAERLHISQQSLSEQLKKMEEEVDAQLIKRGRQVTLTPAGKIFKRSATELLDTYQEMLDEISEISGKDRTRIMLAIPTTETPPFLPGLLTDFSANHPEFKVKIIKCQPKDADKEATTFDLYFSTLPLGDELVHVPVKENDTYAVALVPSLAWSVYGDRWPEIEARLKEEQDISLLRDMPFILLSNRMDDVVLDQEIIFRDAGFPPNVVFQSENSELNANMCVLGSGAYLATMDSCRRRFKDSMGKTDGVMLYPIKTSIDPVVIALSHRKGKRLTKADRCFIEETRAYLSREIT